jgi:hypothetical protein
MDSVDGRGRLDDHLCHDAHSTSSGFLIAFLHQLDDILSLATREQILALGRLVIGSREFSA